MPHPTTTTTARPPHALPIRPENAGRPRYRQRAMQPTLTIIRVTGKTSAVLVEEEVLSQSPTPHSRSSTTLPMI